MKISHIHIENFQGARAVDVAVSTPVLLFTGPNGAGKSSIADAIKLALSGTASRVRLKGDYPLMVSEGAKRGIVRLDTDAGVVEATLPKDKARNVNPMIPFVVDAQHFARLDENARRAALMSLVGVKADREAVAKRMISRGCDAARVDSIVPLLRGGFHAACAEAESKAKDARAQWTALTGEKYGAIKADGWRPELSPFNEQDLVSAQAELQEAEAKLADCNTRTGRADAMRAERTQRQQHLAAQREKAGRLARIQAKLEADRLERAELLATVERMRHAAGVAPRVGLVHDLAQATHDLLVEFGSAGYGGETEVLQDARAVLHTYEKQHGALQDAGQSDPDAAAKLPDYEKALELMERSVTNGERDLADAEAAQREVQEAESLVDAEIIPEAEELRTELRGLMAQRNGAADKVTRLVGLQSKHRSADETAQRAADFYAAAEAWGQVAAALAPDGIPGEILAAALAPVNARMRGTAEIAQWGVPIIGADMAVSLNGRPYDLLSESEQWRVDALIAEAFSHLSGLRIVMLDRFDHLDSTGRGDLIALFEELAESGEVDTAILFGTMKAAPRDLAPCMQALWIEGGTVQAGALKVAA